jgi:hypothetical protein
MASALSPEIGFSPEEFRALYEGAVAIDDVRQRTEACYVILAACRLGVHTDELLHLHEGWIEWTSGELRIPAHDPCACRECWQAAQQRKREGDDRALGEIVGEDCWSPPSRDGRSLSFGWSNRLTGVFGAFFENHDYLDTDADGIESLLDEAAANASGISPSAVTVGALRASALDFLATAGFRLATLCELTGVDESTASQFVDSNGSPSTVCGDEPQYPLVCTAERLSGEPFDPADHDPNWRIQRGVEAEDASVNPRPAVTPEGSSLDAEDLLKPTNTDDAEPVVVAASLADWVAAHEGAMDPETPGDQSQDATDTGDEQQSGGPDGAEDSGQPEAATSVDTQESIATDVSVESVDPSEEVTKPVEFSIDTRFASAAIERGRPTGGSVILGQDELLFLSRDDTGIAGFLSIGIDDIVDLAPGYVPEKLADLFDTTVGIAHLDDAGERKVVVCEVPADSQWAFIQRIFSYVLTDIEVVASEIQQFPRDVEGKTLRLDVEAEKLTFREPGTDQEAVLHLTRVVDVAETKMTHEPGFETGLAISHLGTNDQLVETEVRPTEDRLQDLLKRYLILHRNRKKRRAKSVDIGQDHLEVLRSLYNTGEGRDLMTIIDMDPSRLTDVVTGLKQRDLVKESGAGVKLTATGFLVASYEYGVVRT